MSSKLKTAVRRTYYHTGIVVLEAHYAGGHCHGPYRLWHRNGQLAEERIYRHGLASRPLPAVGRCRQTARLISDGQRDRRAKAGMTTDGCTWSSPPSPANFYGRSRTWLQDGTSLVCRTGLTLLTGTSRPPNIAALGSHRRTPPKLQGRIGKPPVRNSCAGTAHLSPCLLPGCRRNATALRRELARSG